MGEYFNEKVCYHRTQPLSGPAVIWHQEVIIGDQSADAAIRPTQQ